MKIFLPFTIHDIGGTVTFAKMFTAAMTRLGHTVSSIPSSDFDIIFIIADCPLWHVFLAKLLRKRIVQRLDGVYHPATPYGKWYWLYNLKMKIIYNHFADTVIYQSKFSKESCARFLGRTRARKTAIIYNGVDLDAIPAKKELSLHSPIKLLTFAKFRRRDQIEPLLESVKLLDSKKYTFEIYGSYTDNLKHLFDNLPPNIIFQGKKQHEDLLKILHQYNIFLFSDQSACPNSVLEAMAAGLPVVAFDRGSIPELIKSGYNGEAISLQKGSQSFSHSYPFTKRDIRVFTKLINTIGVSFPQYSKNSMEISYKYFSLSRMIREYCLFLTK